MVQGTKPSLIEELVTIKKSHPNLRIGQLIVNAINCDPDDLSAVLFYMDDATLIRHLKSFSGGKKS